MFRVLIVEDEQILANNLVRSIRRAGLEANTSDTGTKALSICHDVVFDVLCIDIGRPPGLQRPGFVGAIATAATSHTRNRDFR